jgi:hypothetical protein
MRCHHVATISWFWQAIAVTLLVFVANANAAEKGPRSKIQAHIAAGEFGPAAALAQKLPAAERDQVLTEMAARQAAAGARQGSLSTLQAIHSDQLRSSAAENMRSQPLVPRVGGGGVIADFDTLIDLVTSTIAPDSWTDNGGTGSISGFPTGVLVDDRGVMSRIASDSGAELLSRRRAALTIAANRNPRVSSKLRKVSLPKLEKALQLRYAQGRGPTDAMRNLAGLQRVQYVFVYEDTGDIVLVGPAGDWTSNPEGRTVSVESGAPVVQLDDLVVVLRNSAGKGTFGCAITPTRENLEAAQVYLADTGKKSLPPGKAAREKWVDGLREKLGLQEIEVHGIDPGSHAARTIVEADYHMKRIGMGLEKGVLGVTSYLDSIELERGETAPPMGVLRWWFTLGDGAIRATEDHTAFEIKGPSVKVLSENELLSERGERIHTGKSDELNAQFATSFTRHFDALAAKYPIYAELRNVFDLAVVAALLKHERVLDRTEWQASHFLNPDQYRIAVETPATQVMSIANYRVINDRTLVAGVSGGVEVNATVKLNSDRLQTDRYGDLEAGRAQSVKANAPSDLWWWD